MKSLWILLLPGLLLGATGDFTMSVHPDGDKVLMFVEGVSTNSLVYTSGLNTNDYTGNERLKLTFDEYTRTDAGVLTKITRTVFGVAHDTFGYPDNSVLRATYDGSLLTSVIHLDQTIFAASSNVTATVVANMLSDGVNGNSAASALSVTNVSSQSYDRPQGSWTTVPFTDVITNRADGQFTVSMIGAHWTAQQRRPLKTVGFWAVDASGNNTGTNYVTEPIIWQTRNRPAKGWEYVCNLPYANLNTNEAVNVYFNAVPWWGSNTLNTADGIHTQPSAYWAPLVLMCDKDNSIRRWYATVDPSGSGTGAYATNYTGHDITGVTNAPPFATIGDAYSAIISSNGIGQFARIGLYPSNYVWITGTVSTGPNPTNAPIFEPMPWANRNEVILSGASGASATDDLDDRVIFRNITLADNENNMISSQFVAWYDCVFNVTANTPIVGATHQYLVNCVVSNYNANLIDVSGQGIRWALVLGVEDYDPSGLSVYPYTVVGYYKGVTNNANRALFVSPGGAQAGGMPTNVVIVGVQGLGGVTSSGTFNTIGDLHFTDGYWISDATIEVIIGGTGSLMNYWSDQATATNTPNKNVTLAHATLVGERQQVGYNDGTGLAPLRGPYQIYKTLTVGAMGMKGSAFAMNSQMTNNLPIMWGHRFGANFISHAPAIAASGFTNEFSGPNSLEPQGDNYNFGYHRFANWAANDGTNAGAGIGDYRLKHTSPHWTRYYRMKNQRALTPYDSRGFRRDPRSAAGDLSAGNPRNGDLL